METVIYQYGGIKGKKLRLVDAKEYVVVRTKSRDYLERTPLGREAGLLLHDWSCVVRFEEAGVEVLRTRRRSRLKEQRDEVRTVLKKEPEVQFAGRVLATRKAREPVIYTENLFVKFADDVSQTACCKLLRKHGLAVKQQLQYAGNAYFVTAPDNCGRKVFELASAVLREETVELCHPELVQAHRERQAFPQQWHLKKTKINGLSINEHANVEAAWPFSQGEGTTIAVIDDGVDVDHEEFSGSNKIVAPRDVTRQRDDVRPQFASERHGTACAGVACGNGVHGASGVAPKAKLMPIRLRSGLGSQQEADAIMWAANHGADVISCSWGPSDGDFRNPDDPRHDAISLLPDSTRLALEFAISNGRNGKGCVITWAAGNGNESVDNDGYAAFEKAVTVGASDDLGKKAPYSDFGDALWCVFPSDHKLPSITPGIWTVDRRLGAGYNPGRSQLGDAEGHYTNRFGGTSSSCPGAAGVAALVIARNPELRWDQVKEILRQCCDQIDTANAEYDDDGHSKLYGYGRLNAKRAVELALPLRPTRTTIHRVIQDIPILDQQTSKIKVTVGDIKQIRNIRVGIDIERSHPGDLVVTLKPPPQTSVPAIVLHSREDGGVTNFKHNYDQTSIPELGNLVGKAPTGTWTIEVQDHANADQGKILQFSVELDY